MITEHTETTSTTPRAGRSSSLSAINHEHGTTTTDPPLARKQTGPRRHPFSRCSRPLYSSQTTTHTPHTLVVRPARDHDHRQDAGNPETPHPDPPARGSTGPVASGPNSAPRTTPPPPGPPVPPPHRPPEGNPDEAGTEEEPGPAHEVRPLAR